MWISEAYWSLEGSPNVKNAWLKTGYSWFNLIILFNDYSVRGQRSHLPLPPHSPSSQPSSTPT